LEATAVLVVPFATTVGCAASAALIGCFASAVVYVGCVAMIVECV